MPSFDGPNLLITLDSGVTEVDVEIDLYSDWKEFFKTSDNSKFPLAFRTIGGDPLTGTLDAGAYFFLRNDLGWRIRPFEEDATITFVGNLAAQDSTLPIVVPTTGAFTVLVLGLQPVTQAVGSVEADVTKWLGSGVAAAVAGVPDVNTKRINDAVVVGDGNATPWDGA